MVQNHQTREVFCCGSAACKLKVSVAAQRRGRSVGHMVLLHNGGPKKKKKTKEQADEGIKGKMKTPSSLSMLTR